jgi:hypothetical protein
MVGRVALRKRLTTKSHEVWSNEAAPYNCLILYLFIL